MGTMHIACCGLDCSRCPLFQGTLRADPEDRRLAIPQLRRRFGERLDPKRLIPEALTCHGCRAADAWVFFGAADCCLRACCQERNRATCAECDRFDHCEHLQSLFGRQPEARQTLERMRVLR